MSSIGYLRDADGVVTLTLDAPGMAVNTMDDRFRADLASTVERLEAERDRIHGVIVTSAKPTFFAGGDLRTLLALEPKDEERFFGELQQIKSSLRRLETLGRPVVAAINGSALGGGLEIALACHHRICIDSASIRIGFPEVTLGLLPGAGGVVKTVRLLGLLEALPYLTQGTRLTPHEARRTGFVDALAGDRETLIASARQWIETHPKPSQPWDEPASAIPGGGTSSPAVAAGISRYQAAFGEGAQSNYPAPAAILAVAIEAAQSDFDTAMRIESRHLSALACGQVAKNMIGTLFFQLNEIRSGGGRPADEPASTVTRVGIVGAGMMGSAIAAVCATRGVSCLLMDKTAEQSRAGRERAAAVIFRQVEKGLIGSSDAKRILEAIRPVQTAADLSGCELVIEAVFENRELKASVTREVEAFLGTDAVLATNTSTLPITDLARAASRQQQFIGIHFFSPVERMQLVEIIRGRRTSPRTVARAYDFALQVGKTPIVVNDSRGFFTSRVFGTFVNEGMALLGEGVPAAMIEEIAIQAGMPAGPLAVLDEISLKLVDDVLHQELAELEREAHGHGHDHGHDHDHGHEHGHEHEHEHGSHHHGHDHHDAHAPAREHTHDHEHRHSHDVESKRMPKPAVYVLEKMAHGFKRMGRGHGGGFYDYPEGEPKQLWPGLKAFERRARSIPAEEIRERLLYVQSIEAVRCLQESVLENVRDANVGSILGWGFPAYTGGAIQLINHVGPSAFVARARDLAAKHGVRFEPPALLVDRAQRGIPL